MVHCPEPCGCSIGSAFKGIASEPAPDVSFSAASTQKSPKLQPKSMIVGLSDSASCLSGPSASGTAKWATTSITSNAASHAQQGEGGGVQGYSCNAPSSHNRTRRTGWPVS
ncbi:uncharacterized protein K452DRAFT_291685 [Aplosporella prunicola CBS 121167]|uniref:Uncharacterized protein n=1 Tax=Aplosporella prunicola CBS 121167 TaxID=1176127 RepID=A0A6A6B076_9PEZI|nr:uncharacterized protein K452DRAFT_291685 [Aplosporella prunicola CBS 121167]KAF2137276.1 hypothetical protein K452DRAFT_291685 [Aplosporella prunicola CBS 121167]